MNDGSMQPFGSSSSWSMSFGPNGDDGKMTMQSYGFREFIGPDGQRHREYFGDGQP